MPEIKKDLKKYIPHLLQAQADNLNEADTVQRLTKFFEDVLGYDPLEELSFEAQLKNKYIDMVLKIDGKIRILVEVKAAGVKLRDRHIEQAQMYASRNNYTWVLLTNGVVWNLYHLTFDEGIEYEKAFTVDVSKDKEERVVELLGLLHRNSIKRGRHEDYWTKRRILSAGSIGQALFHERTLREIRREVRRREGVLLDVEELAPAIHSMLSVEARELIGPVRIRKAPPRNRKPRAAPDEPTGGGVRQEAAAPEASLPRRP